MAKEARVQKQEVTLPDSREVAEIAARAGLDRKAEFVKILDVQGLTSYADFLVLMSAGSERQVSAIADAVDHQLREAGIRPIGVEGQGAGNWILIDSGDVVVHVFNAEAREFYDLDSLWADARQLPVEVTASVSA